MGISRRRFVLSGAALAGGMALVACGTGNAPGPVAAGGPPRPGGTLRVGALGKASGTVRDPHGVLGNESDYLITALAYDTLTAPGAHDPVAPRLAARWEPSADLTRWTFTLAEKAAFHDGSPVTADDVVWSLKRLRGTPSGPSRLPGVAVDGIAAAGPNAVTLTSAYPNAALPLQVRLNTFVLKSDTTDLLGAPGTGPFRLESFSGGNARLVRNDAWYGGAPHLDAVEVRMFDSPQAMANALFTGQLDLASNVGPVAARTAAGRAGVQTVRRAHDTVLSLVIRTSDGPFADVRVRQAFRLAVDRPALVAQALSGFGAVANDVLGTADPALSTDLPQRVRDLDAAAKLLDEAAFDRSRTYPLITTEDIPGLAESAALMARQLADVGVRIDVVTQDSGAFYADTWLKAPLYTTWWGTNDSVLFFAAKTLDSGSGSNETAFHDAGFDAAYRKAVGDPAPAARAAALAELQRIEYDRSGYLAWGTAEGIDLATDRVRDLPQLPGYGRVQLERTWLAT